MLVQEHSTLTIYELIKISQKKTGKWQQYVRLVKLQTHKDMKKMVIADACETVSNINNLTLPTNIIYICSATWSLYFYLQQNQSDRQDPSL